MLAVSHPTGNTFVRALLHTLQERSLLQTFFTTVAVHEDDWGLKLLPAKLRQQVLRRSYDVPHASLMRLPLREAIRQTASQLKIDALVQHESGWASLDAVYQELDARVASRLKGLKSAGLTGVYCYEDGALQTFLVAQQLGLNRFYELPIAYWEKSAQLLAEEAARWPQWEPTLVGTRDSAAKLERKTRELELAEVVIVPGAFVLDSLPEWARRTKKCVVAPFGSPSIPDEIAEATQDRDSASRPLRVLFAGSMTQRKGLADLFAAIGLLNRNDVELVVMGTPVAPLDFYQNQGVKFRYEAPRPHSQVLELMRDCDVLALPSIIEGRALVQQEAMMCGLPLLVTANAGGEDLVEEGKTGFLVPIRSPETVAEKIGWFADHRGDLPPMRAAARAKASTYSWENYGQTIVETVTFLSHEET